MHLARGGRQGFGSGLGWGDRGACKLLGAGRGQHEKFPTAQTWHRSAITQTPPNWAPVRCCLRYQSLSPVLRVDRGSWKHTQVPALVNFGQRQYGERARACRATQRGVLPTLRSRGGEPCLQGGQRRRQLAASGRSEVVALPLSDALTDEPLPWPPPLQWRKMGHAMVDFIADYQAGIEQMPVRSQVQPGYLR